MNNHVRPATTADLPAIVAMLSDDDLGATREQAKESLDPAYARAFERISNDPHQQLVVLTLDSGEVIGTLQLTLIPYLTYTGGLRAQIEAVRVHRDHRGGGHGKTLIEWAIARAASEGAHLVQLTTDKRRKDAAAFYERLGFQATHEGMKLHLQAVNGPTSPQGLHPPRSETEEGT